MPDTTTAAVISVGKLSGGQIRRLNTISQNSPTPNLASIYPIDSFFADGGTYAGMHFFQTVLCEGD